MPCDSLADERPEQTFEGRVAYDNTAQCTEAGRPFTEVRLSKSVALNPATASGTRRLADYDQINGRRLSGGNTALCAGVVVNGNDATVGDAVGSGLTISGVSSVTLCVQPAASKLSHVTTFFPQ